MAKKLKIDFSLSQCACRRDQPPTPMMPPSSAAGSMAHFGVAVMARSLSQPAAYISMPVHAIMAALSVQSSGGGKASWIP